MKTTICTFCHQPINGKPGQILLNPLEYSHKVDAGIMHSLTTFVIRRYSHASLKEVLSNRLMLRLCPQTRFAKVVNFALCMYRDAEFASTMCADEKANQAEVREILRNINSPNVKVQPCPRLRAGESFRFDNTLHSSHSGFHCSTYSQQLYMIILSTPCREMQNLTCHRHQCNIVGEEKYTKGDFNGRQKTT